MAAIWEDTFMTDRRIRQPRRRSALPAGVLAVVIPALSLAVLLAPPVSRAAAPIQVGYIGVSTDAGLFVAQDKGYFREQGLDLSFERLGAAADQMALLGAGRLQIASGGVSPTLFNTVSRGLPIAAVADKGSLRKGFGFNVFVVRRALVDSGQYKDVRDLRGRVLASNSPASPINFETFMLLKKGGLTLRDVRMEYMDFGDEPAAMANGKIDAAVMVEPFATAAEQRGIGKIITTLDRVVPDFQVALIFYNTDWARGHQDEARRWMVAYIKGLRYYNQAARDRAVREDVISIMAAHTPIKDRAVYNKMTWAGFNPDGTINVRSLLDYERWLVNERQVSEFIPPARFIDASYAQYAVKTLGLSHP